MGAPHLVMIGNPEDLTATYLGWKAERRGAQVTVLDESRFGLDWGWERNGSLRIVTRDGSFRLDDAARDRPGVGLSVRFRPDPAVPADLDPGDAELEITLALERRASIEYMLNEAAVPVANRPRSGRANGAKPLQMAALAALGLRVPEWIVTNDPADAEAFVDALPDGAIVKSVSGARSRVRRYDQQTASRLEEPTTPVLIQRRIPGHDARVHTVGDRAFGCAIDVEGIDYRFESEDANYRPVDVPRDVASACFAAAAHEGLLLAGTDFRVDDDGRWWCLEVNPVPTFLPYEMAADLPIADAVLDELLG